MIGITRDLDLMTIRETADYLGVSISWLARKRSDNRGPKYIKTNRVYYKREDVIAFLENQRQERKTA